MKYTHQILETIQDDSHISNNDEGDLGKLKELRSKYVKNPCLAYLNINSLRGNKFHQLKGLLKELPLEILCIDETKLTPDFTTAQFHIEGYQYPPHRRDRRQTSSRGKIVYIRDGIISKRLEKYETEHAETICLELTIKNKKWFILFGYRPESIDRYLFFEGINDNLARAVNQNQIVITS